MSSISSTSSAGNPYQATNQNAFVQFVNDFNDIGNALQSGNVSSAQNALTTFQQNLPGGSQNPSAKPFGNNSQANSDFSNLSSALQSGDLSGAQKAYASLQTDLESGGKTQGHHHRHGSGGAESATSSSSTSTSSSTESTSDSADGTTSDSSEEINTLLDVMA